MDKRQRIDKSLVLRYEDILPVHRNEHPDFAYAKHMLVPKGAASHCTVSVYEVPPGKAAYPSHYHLESEEIFFILKGEGLLCTPEGQRRVTSGDFCFFPACAAGAHKLLNPSADEALVYIDFDTYHELDVALYPDSGKVGVWGKGLADVFYTADNVGYYDGE